MVRIVRRLDRDGIQNAASPLTNPMPLQALQGHRHTPEGGIKDAYCA